LVGHDLRAVATLVDITRFSYIVGMIVGNLNLTGIVFAAPLAGVSNRPFRVLAIRAGAAITYTEMVSSEGIIRNQKKTLAMMKFSSDEQPLGIQLFGSNPEVMGQATKLVVSQYTPDLIDLNFGCPVRKVVNKNGGAAVLKDMGLTSEIVCATVEADGDTPVTIKIRSGWDDAHPVFVEAGQVAESAGAAAVTLHARSRSAGFSGKADWSDIKKLKEAVSIPVVGNGDVVTPADARQMLDQTGCDSVMVGRASMGNPFVFKEINHYLETGSLLPSPTLEERINISRQHAQLMIEEYGEARAAKMMRKYFGWYVRGFPGAVDLRKRLVAVESMADIDSVFNSYLAEVRSTD
jgi:tRNA-dihydrouridine synthase B